MARKWNYEGWKRDRDAAMKANDHERLEELRREFEANASNDERMNEKGNSILGWMLGFVALAALAGLVVSCIPEEGVRVAREARKAEKVRVACEREIRFGNGPFHSAVKRHLKDPSSYEVEYAGFRETQIPGVVEAYSSFRSRNSFGGMASGFATGIVDTRTIACRPSKVEVLG